MTNCIVAIIQLKTSFNFAMVAFSHFTEQCEAAGRSRQGGPGNLQKVPHPPRSSAILPSIGKKNHQIIRNFSLNRKKKPSNYQDGSHELTAV
jgi:hypothetical protein